MLESSVVRCSTSQLPPISETLHRPAQSLTRTCPSFGRTTCRQFSTILVRTVLFCPFYIVFLEISPLNLASDSDSGSTSSAETCSSRRLPGSVSGRPDTILENRPSARGREKAFLSAVTKLDESKAFHMLSGPNECGDLVCMYNSHGARAELSGRTHLVPRIPDARASVKCERTLAHAHVGSQHFFTAAAQAADGAAPAG